MGVIGGLVIYALLWFLCVILVMPRGQPTQIEAGEITPGTPGGAPATLRVGRKFLYATVMALVIWAAIFVIVEFDLLTLEDFEFLFPPSLRGSIE